jgi:hypothetical protein
VTMNMNEKRPLMISRGWIQAAVLVLMSGFSSWACLLTTPTTTNRPYRNRQKHKRIDLIHPC